MERFTFFQKKKKVRDLVEKHLYEMDVSPQFFNKNLLFGQVKWILLGKLFFKENYLIKVSEFH